MHQDGNAGSPDVSPGIRTPPQLPAPVALAAVPVGAVPVAPAVLPPAQNNDDHEGEVEGAHEHHKAKAEPLPDPSPFPRAIFAMALVVITLSAVVSFYAMDAAKSWRSECPAATAFNTTTGQYASADATNATNAAGEDAAEKQPQ
ncbi:uncharacterized protein LOC144118336 isoform X1 [Amblyomma americanum]